MRKLFKFFIRLVLVAVLVFAGFLLFGKLKEKNLIPTSPCGKPIRYAVGNVDQKFGISADDFSKITWEAEKIWEDQAGMDLFEYDPQAPLKINLLFDERQKQFLETEELEERLERIKLSDSELKKEYDALYDSYAAKLQDYNADVTEYEALLKDYNKDVAYWNKRGGAPEDEYRKLDKKRDKLEEMQDDLEKKRKEINSLAKKINALVAKENQIIKNYNETAETYRDKYGGAREFEKGLYDGKEINIYQYDEVSDLKLTVIHEFGHALGIGHVENPQSIMYYLLADQDMNNPKFTSEDISALKEVCKIK